MVTLPLFNVVVPADRLAMLIAPFNVAGPDNVKLFAPVIPAKLMLEPVNVEVASKVIAPV